MSESQMECLGSENNISNMSGESVENASKEEECSDVPSECKIAKTDMEAAEGVPPADSQGELIAIKVVYNKKKYDVSVGTDATVAAFKVQLKDLLGVPEAMQKLMYKGMLQDANTIAGSGITKGAKIMLVGSTLNDVLAMTSVSKQDVADMEKAASSKEPLCKQKIHRKVLDKGVPDDAMPGIKNLKEELPPAPLSGMLNKHGGKVRLTFKLENDQLWLSTKERTEKLPMASIKSVLSEPIDEHEEYHIMGLQLGPTEASRYWLYWVPAQYADAIKDAILGKWQYF